MYIPAHFAIEDPEVLRRIIREHPLGALVTSGPQGLDANHIPFEFDDEQGKGGNRGNRSNSGEPGEPGALGRLTAHVARANPVWQQASHGAEVMVIFRGNEHYISPNWYPSKHETHRQVPTWNYEVVHVHGRLSVMDDERFVRGVVARLTRQHESGEPRPWKMGDSPPDYIEQMLRAVVGIEVAITRIEGKAKLSQNREPRDRVNAADTLLAQGAVDLGRAMREAKGPAP